MFERQRRSWISRKCFSRLRKREEIVTAARTVISPNVTAPARRLAEAIAMKPIREIVPSGTRHVPIQRVLITLLAATALTFALPGLDHRISTAFANAISNINAS